MAKMGAANAPSLPMASPRPMPNPRLGTPASSPRPEPNPRLNPQAPQQQGGGGLFPNMGVQERFDMAMELLKNGMSMAAQSNNPLAAFLGPLAGAAIGGGIENKRAKLMDQQNDQLMSAMMPGANQDELQRLTDVVNNPDAPEYLKSIAKARLDAAVKPFMPGYVAPGSGGGKKGGGGGGGRGGGKAAGGGDPAKPKQKLYGEYDIGGVLYGRNAYGEMIPYTDSSGAPVKSGKATPPTVPTGDLAPPTGAVTINGYTIEEIE